MGLQVSAVRFVRAGADREVTDEVRTWTEFD